MKLFWSKVWTILKSYGVIVSAITIISVTAVKIDRKRQHDTEVDKNLHELIDTTHTYFKDIDKRLETIENSIDRIDNKVDNLGIKVQEQGKAIEQTQTSFKQYALRDKTLTKEEFYSYMQNLQYENSLKSENIVSDKTDYKPQIKVIRK